MADNRELTTFVGDALGRGATREQIHEALTRAGWSAADVAAALRGYADVEFPIPVPRPRPSLSARDAFQYLVLFGTLYICAFNLGQLLYQLIDVAFPDPAWVEQRAQAIPDLIRWSIAALIVSTPIFVFTARANARALERSPAMRHSPIRRFLTYLTLAVAAGILIGDSITALYRLLSGDLTVPFILKAVTLAGISGAIFYHYLADLRRDEVEAQS
ncbi:MAG TPA: DUF5671 domain-containing protein [Gemmatimonadales bacterium]|jgi:hypothetical protein